MSSFCDNTDYWDKHKKRLVNILLTILIISFCCRYVYTVTHGYLEGNRLYNDALKAKEECLTLNPQSNHNRASCEGADKKASTWPIVYCLGFFSNTFFQDIQWIVDFATATIWRILSIIIIVIIIWTYLGFKYVPEKIYTMPINNDFFGFHSKHE